MVGKSVLVTQWWPFRSFVFKTEVTDNLPSGSLNPSCGLKGSREKFGGKRGRGPNPKGGKGPP